MKEKIFINARIIDPSQKMDEVGSLILNEKGKVKAIGKNIKKMMLVMTAEDNRCKRKYFNSRISRYESFCRRTRI